MKNRIQVKKHRRGGFRQAAGKAVCACLSLLFLSGCSSLPGFAEGDTMRPPRPTGEKAAIYSVLETEAGSGFTLKYPSGGEYRSAIIMEDLTGDGQQEAVALFQKKEDSSRIHFMLIQKQGKTWKNMGAFSQVASQVDKIDFGDVDGDGNKEAIVGWGNSQTGSTGICVYHLDSDGQVEELNLDQSYSQMLVMDMDGDGYEEIFTANVAIGDQPAAARLFRIRSGAIEVQGTALLDSSVSRYVNVAGGLLNPDQQGIVLDGSRSAYGYVTEVVYWDSEANALRTPFLDTSTGNVSLTARTNTVLSKDVNGDKILEIPVSTLLPGFSVQNAAKTSYVTDWQRYDAASNTLERVMTTITDADNDFWFLVPDMWRNRITTEADAETRSLTFYTLKEVQAAETEEFTTGDTSAVLEKDEPLLRIRVFTAKQWAAGEDTEGYFKILDSNSLVYAAENLAPGHELSMSDSDVRNSFRLAAQES